MILTELSCAALGIAVISAIGRALLCWLPPGELGSHRTAQLPATWAASYLLGGIAISIVTAACALARLPFSCAGIVGVGALLALARGLSLPAALVPRHEVLSERPENSSRALFAIALGIVAWAAWQMDVTTETGHWATRAQALLSRGSIAGIDDPANGALAAPPFESTSLAFIAWPNGAVSSSVARLHWLACALAVLLLSERAMATARRAPLGRRMLLVPLALALAVAATADDGNLGSAALIALLVCGLVAWTRRADARGLALACLSSGALPLTRPDGWVLGCAGLIAVLASSARPSMKRALIWTLGSGLFLMVPWPLAGWTRGIPWFDGEPLAPLASSWALGGNPWLAAWIAPVWIAFGATVGPISQRLLHAPHAGVDASDADRARRDLAALCLLAAAMAVGALLLLVLSGQPLSLVAKTWAPGLLVQAAPLAAVFAARGLVRAERAH